MTLLSPRLSPLVSFQLTRSRGAWLNINLPCGVSVSFQLTRSRGAWPTKPEFYCAHGDFNSHAHVERDSHISPLGLVCPPISTHTLTWSVTWCSCHKCVYLRFQLTRSRGAWLNINLPCGVSVSFQLTRSRGAWPTKPEFYCAHGDFNSHAHVERDSHISPLGLVCPPISTHTLTWSVTWCSCHKCVYLRFQLTRSRGAWLVFYLRVLAINNFNSHAHVERDSKNGIYTILALNFNSHAHVERDYKLLFWLMGMKISTHTLTWSVTSIFHYLLIFFRISTHTLTWSVTPT